jgi:26S proteasome regulatory subunit N9
MSLLHVLLDLQVKKDYAEFYRSSMMYLAFISSDTPAYDFKLPLAVDIGLAALLGEGIYNFAQLLMHPIVQVMGVGGGGHDGRLAGAGRRGGG